MVGPIVTMKQHQELVWHQEQDGRGESVELSLPPPHHKFLNAKVTRTLQCVSYRFGEFSFVNTDG